MQYIFQFAILGAIAFLGEILNVFLPLPIPGNIYGFFILLILLCSGAIQLKQVETVGRYLISLFPVFFIAPVVGLMENFSTITNDLIAILIATIALTPVTILVSGHLAQWIRKRRYKTGEAQSDE